MNGKAGAGVYCKDLSVAYSVSLGCYTTVFQAEVYAILEALLWCMNHNCKKVDIYSDSQAALLSLGNATIKSGIVEDCRNTLSLVKTRGFQVSLIWVPGHTEIEGNEEADRLARAGSEGLPIGCEPTIPVGPAYARKILETKLAKNFQNEWANTSGMQCARAFLPPPSTKFGLHLEDFSRGKARRLTWFLTGHGHFRKHMAKMDNSIVNTSCRKCSLQEETANHLLCECPALSRIRTKCFGEGFISVETIRNASLRTVSKFIDGVELWGDLQLFNGSF